MRTISVLLLCIFVGGLLSVAAVSYGQQGEHKISLNLVDADIRDALTMLFRGTDKNFVLTGDANTATRVTVKLDGVDFETALYLILQQAGLQAKAAGNVYTISPAVATAPTGYGTRPTAANPPVPTGTGTPVTPGTRSSLEDIFNTTPTSSTYDTSTATGTEAVTETIKIYYADAVEIAQLFGGTVAQGRFSSGQTGTSGYGGMFGGIGGMGGYGGLGGYGSSGYGGYGSSGYGGYGSGYGGYGSGYGGYGSSGYGSRYGSSGYGSYGSRRSGYSGYGGYSVPPAPPG
jgi:hypothetical protein